MYGALVAAPDSIRTGLLKAFAPRTSPPSTASVLRSILWPIAILLIIHRSYVLATNGYITDDYGPVYRAVVNFKMGWDIYNEHFDYVDPHYLYPPGGTLLMAPFGYLPVDASRYWFITFNTIAIVIAAYLLIRLFNFTFTSVAFPALLVAMFCTESVINTLVFANINGCVLLLELLFFHWLLDGKTSHQWWAGVAIGLSLVVKPVLAPLLLLPLLNRQWRAVVTAILCRRVQRGSLAVGKRPDGLRHPHAALHLSTRDYFNSSIPGNGVYYGLPMWLIVLLRLAFARWRSRSLWLLYRYYRTRDPLFWMLHVLGCAADRFVAGVVAWPGLLLDDAVSVPDDGRAANSVIRNWPAWLAIYGFMSADRWLLALADDGRASWSHEGHLRLVPDADVVFCVLYFRYLDAKADGRLDDGIDPLWMKAAAKQPAPA